MYNANEKVEPVNVAEEVSRSFLDYSMSVIISRALPDARDGLKPSQRRILYAMNELGVMPGRKHLKCAKIVGETMGNYHPHGDQAIYPTLVHMAQPWAMRERLVDGKGNFGSVEDDPPASMRYTEARLTHMGAALMTDMEKETVDFVPTYDEQRHPHERRAADRRPRQQQGRHRHHGRAERVGRKLPPGGRVAARSDRQGRHQQSLPAHATRSFLQRHQPGD